MTLAIPRDVALLILVAEAFVVGFVALAFAYVALTALQRLVPKVHEGLHVAQRWTVRVQLAVTAAMGWLLAPILVLSGLSAGLRETARALRRREIRDER